MKECNQCGKCCIKYGNGGLSASQQEIQWWDSTRPDIFEYTRNGKIWMDPESGKLLQRCPWLRIQKNDIYTCDIYFDRPDDCKYYPVTIDQMVNDACEMLEPHDMADLGKAQKTLDKLMSDSRPPYE